MTSSSVRIPERLAASAERAGHHAWLEQLPALIEQLAGRWQLQLGPAYMPGGFWAWVAPGTRADGASIVLKLSLPERQSGERPALARWNGAGAARLLAADDASGALLLEQLLPGTPLAAADDAVQQQVAVELCRQLWQPQAGLSVSPRLPSLDERLLRYRRDIVRIGDEQFLSALPAPENRPTARRVLVHGDLHEENILLGPRGYAAIDPEPAIGEREFDVEPLLRRYLDRDLPAGAIELLERLQRQLGVNPRRVLVHAQLRACVYGSLCFEACDQSRTSAWRRRLQQLARLAQRRW